MSESGFEEIRGRLREVARNVACGKPSAHVESTVLREFRRHRARRRLWNAAKLAAVAACLIVLFAAATFGVRQWFASPAPVAEGNPQPALVEPESSLRAVPQEQPAAEKLARRAPKRPRPVLTAAPAEPPEIATGFIPVGLGVAFGPGERASLVRVRLPRSALATFGLPVNENRVAEFVKADILLGEDGVARAVRFVQ